MKLKLIWYGTLAVLAYGLLGADQCKPTPTPTPPPTPTPNPVVDVRPTSPVYLDLLLRASPEGTWVRNGTPHTMVGAIPCWPTEGTAEKLIIFGKVTDYWWSLVSPQFMDTVAPLGVNAVHVRLGPSVAAEMCCGLEDVGGPYVEMPAKQLMKAKLRKVRLEPGWNEKYWAKLHQIMHHAGRTGINVQVDVLDGWLIKHSVWGETHMPWPAQDVLGGFQVPLNPSVKAWVTKVTSELCFYGNGFYEISNESSLGPGWTPAWEREMFNLIRQEEQRQGCVIKVTGSNTRDFSGPYDYFATHNATELEGPADGNRPMIVNEYNPALPPATFKARYCASQKAGQSYWWWRSDGSDEWQDASLRAIQAGCEGVVSACPDPQPGSVSEFACVDRRVWWDCTPKQHGCEYCASIGMGTYNGQIRCDCPIRNECPDTPGYEGMCESRVVCEKAAMGGFPVWKGDGAVTVNFANENQLQARCDGCSTLTICAADGITGCTKVY